MRVARDFRAGHLHEKSSVKLYCKDSAPPTRDPGPTLIGMRTHAYTNFMAKHLYKC